MKRFVVLKTPWWECIAAGVPYLMAREDKIWVVDPRAYYGPDLVQTTDGSWEFQTDVIMNPHRAPELAGRWNENNRHVVLYEAENLLAPNGWRCKSEIVRKLAPRCEWWNYSAVNAQVFGDTPAPLWVRPVRTQGLHVAPDLDVVFVGSMNPRRARILDQLSNAGLLVAATTGPLFGPDLVTLENRGRVVLNMHYYEPGIFESFRVVPAVSRGRRVVSEASAGGEGSDIAKCVPYDLLVETVLHEVKRV